jgi:SAM-dependent methyltransferase
MQLNEQPDWIDIGELEFLQRNCCPVCASEAGTPLYRKIIAGYQMHFWLCAACDALYARNVVSEGSVERLFGSKDFFAAGKPGGDNIDYYDFVGGEKFLRKTARGRISRIKTQRSRGRLLEVASAAGFFLIEAKDAGYEVQGVEISAPMASYASHRWKVPVTAASIERMELAPETYDVIASWGVMTIIRDPVSLVRKFHRALRPGGVWAFNTYYHDCVWHRASGSKWYILGIQTSQIFSKKLLFSLVSREGFQLVSRRRDWPHTDLLKIADLFGTNTGLRWLAQAVQRTGLDSLIVKLPLPDVYEYIWQKK